MTLNGITESQRRAAKAVGFVYLGVLSHLTVFAADICAARLKKV